MSGCLSIYLGRFPQLGGSRQHKRNHKNSGCDSDENGGKSGLHKKKLFAFGNVAVDILCNRFKVVCMNFQYSFTCRLSVILCDEGEYKDGVKWYFMGSDPVLAFLLLDVFEI